LPNSNGATLFAETVEVNSGYETNTIYFDNSNNAWDDVAFSVVTGDQLENYYCLDNVRIEKESSS